MQLHGHVTISLVLDAIMSCTGNFNPLGFSMKRCPSLVPGKDLTTDKAKAEGPGSCPTSLLNIVIDLWGRALDNKRSVVALIEGLGMPSLRGTSLFVGFHALSLHRRIGMVWDEKP